MKKGLKMNPNVAETAGQPDATTAVATELHERCFRPYVPGVEQILKFLLDLLMEDLYTARNASRHRERHCKNFLIVADVDVNNAGLVITGPVLYFRAIFLRVL